MHQEDKQQSKCICTEPQSCKILGAKSGLKGKTDKPTIRAENFNILLSAIDKTTRQKIRKDTEGSNAISQHDLIDIY